MNFASDNVYGVHPKILAALTQVNGGTAPSYGGDDHTIRAEANYAILECLSDRDPIVNMVGRYLDVLVRTDDGFRLKDRWCVYDNYRIRTSLIVPV